MRGSVVLMLLDDVERRRVADLLDRQQRRARPVDPDDVGLRRKAVADVRDVADVDRVGADRPDRQVVQLLDRLRAGVEVDVVLGAADLLRAARQNQVLQADRVDHVGRRQVPRLHRLRDQVDLDLRLLAAVRIGNLRALTLASWVRRKFTAMSNSCCSDSLLPESASCSTGTRRRVVGEDERRLRAGRQLPQLRLRRRGHLRDRQVDLGARLEEHLDDGDAAQRLRLDVLDVVHRRGQVALVDRDDAVGHLVRRQAAVVPDDADDRDVDVGEDVSRRAGDGERAHHQDEQSQHHKGVRPS